MNQVSLFVAIASGVIAFALGVAVGYAICLFNIGKGMR